MKATRELVACPRRELTLRKRVYPGLVNGKKMSADQCRHEIACMDEIVTLLGKVAAWEEEGLCGEQLLMRLELGRQGGIRLA